MVRMKRGSWYGGWGSGYGNRDWVLVGGGYLRWSEGWGERLVSLLVGS